MLRIIWSSKRWLFLSVPFILPESGFSVKLFTKVIFSAHLQEQPGVLYFLSWMQRTDTSTYQGTVNFLIVLIPRQEGG